MWVLPQVDCHVHSSPPRADITPRRAASSARPGTQAYRPPSNRTLHLGFCVLYLPKAVGLAGMTGESYEGGQFTEGWWTIGLSMRARALPLTGEIHQCRADKLFAPQHSFDSYQ